MPRVLTDEHLATIAWADPDERTADLARRINAPPTVVRSARHHIHQAGGWRCVLRLTHCAVCGGPLLGRNNAGPRQRHTTCTRARHSLSRTAVRQRDQAITREHAHHADRLWKPEEDARILAPRDRSDRTLALELGRTLVAIHARRAYLRKRERSGSRAPTTRRAPHTGKRVRTRPHPPIGDALRRAGWLSIPDAAALAGVTPHTVRRWMRCHPVPKRRVGQGHSITPEAFTTLQETVRLGTVIPTWRKDQGHAGMLLRHLREAAELSQLELAAATGLSHEAISMLELGKRWPQAETVRRLAHALGVAPERFISRQPVGLSMITVAEAASRLDVSHSRIQSWLKQGVLPGTKVSGQWRVPNIAVDELARSGRLRGRSGRLDPRFRG